MNKSAHVLPIVNLIAAGLKPLPLLFHTSVVPTLAYLMVAFALQ